MPRNPRYDILFEPVRVGPVTAPNRFYQTPHATGMGYLRPESGAKLRGIKAEGGWGVVCTEYCSIHPSSDDSPFGFLTLWDEDDVRSLMPTVEAIHDHGSLAGVELWHGGSHANNRLTREPVLAPSARPALIPQPGSARAMDKADIKAFRTWHRDAALRARRAGFDIVYCYAGHDYLPFQFLSPRLNLRGDEYGGSLANRVRLLRELIEDTHEAVGDRCAVAVRLSVDELHGPRGITSQGEGREILAMLAELPDLWDVNVSGSLGNDSRSARFSDEGFQEEHVAFVKALTSKPVVSVGRFTSPDSMVSQVRRGIQDFIGAARPSIADPFLPRKIDEGREDEIRECIGCNICRSANNEAVPLRCTQNPTIGEEWRRGWHPERIETTAGGPSRVLVVGSGPAGLECALTLGRRGHRVMLAEAERRLGGRINRESTLPGLASWARVRDYRLTMIGKLPAIELFPESPLAAEDVLGLEAEHVVLATGSRWRRDGIGSLGEEAADLGTGQILTPDDIFAGAEVGGPVLIYDDEHYAMGGALAETFRRQGHEVRLATPAAMLSSWTVMTDEQFFIHRRLLELGVEPLLGQRLAGAADGVAELACTYTGRIRRHDFGTLVLVTGRMAEDGLYRELADRAGQWAAAGLRSVTRIGDCLAPSSIADAVHAGHRWAREFDRQPAEVVPRRERPLPA